MACRPNLTERVSRRIWHRPHARRTHAMSDEARTDEPSALVMSSSEQFSPEQVRRILQRASEIDAHGEHASVDELRRIAREAGIDLRAMELAISEVVDGTGPPALAPEADVQRRTSAPARDTLVQSILLGALAGVSGGALFGVGMMTIVAGLGFGGLFLFSLVRAAQLGRKGAILEFELQNLVTMALAAAAAVPFAGPLYDDDVAAGLMMLWIVTAVLGGGLVWWLGRDDDAGAEADD